MRLDPLTFSLAILVPGLTLFLIGSGIRLFRTVTSKRDSLLGIRMSMVGLVTFFLVPAASILVAVIGGWLRWPAALGAVVCLALAIRMMGVAQRYWHPAMPDHFRKSSVGRSK